MSISRAAQALAAVIAFAATVAGEGNPSFIATSEPYVVLALDVGASMTHDLDTSSLVFPASGDDQGLAVDLMEDLYGEATLEAMLGPDYRSVLVRGPKLVQAKRAIAGFLNASPPVDLAFTTRELSDLSVAYLSFVYRVREMIDSDDDGVPDTAQGAMLDGTLPGSPMRFGSRAQMFGSGQPDPVFPIRFGENGDELFVENADPFGGNLGTPSVPVAGDLRLVAFLVDARDPAASPLWALTAAQRRASSMYYYPAYFWGTPGVADGLSWGRGVQEGLEGILTWAEVATLNGLDTADPAWEQQLHDEVIEDITMAGDPWVLPPGTLTESNQIGSEVLFIAERYEMFDGGGWTPADAITCPACASPRATEVEYLKAYLLLDHDPYDGTPPSSSLFSFDFASDCTAPSVPTVPLSAPDPLTGLTGDQGAAIDRWLLPQTTPVFYFPDHAPRFVPARRDRYLPLTEAAVAAGRRPLSSLIQGLDSYFSTVVDTWSDPTDGCRARRVILITDGIETCSSPASACVAANSISVPVDVLYLGTPADVQAPDLGYLQCIADGSGGSLVLVESEAGLEAALLAIRADLTTVGDPDFTLSADPLESDQELTLDASWMLCYGGAHPLWSWTVSGPTLYAGCPAEASCVVPAATLSPGTYTVDLVITNQDAGQEWRVSLPLTVVPDPAAVIFADSFESGDLTRWSSAVG